MFKDPARYDPVYQVTQKIFDKDDGLNLRRDSKAKHRIRRQAFRRFLFGYPPRKQGDTSIGDAINWEWIVECSEKHKAEIWIVSRDSDYGVTHQDQSYLNDWLRAEFSDRVSRKRKIVLTKKLSEALKEFKVQVTQAEEREEDIMVSLLGLRPGYSKEEYQKAMAEFWDTLPVFDEAQEEHFQTEPPLRPPTKT